ncbi:MAG: SMC-Scp complex subunit ScpB [Candidatus Odyssella sp.]|nr:SMC-Scp complex subunit ScpB [Candidatus Odyssella sp.]
MNDTPTTGVPTTDAPPPERGDAAAPAAAAADAAAPAAVAAEADVAERRALAKHVAEALIFASPEPLSQKAIADRMPAGTDVEAVLSEIASDYAQRGIRLVKIAEAWTFRTAPELAPHLQLERKVTRKLSRAALEALGIVAYHQPVTRAEIEDIRGVALSKGTLDVLLEAGWIKPGKRRRTPGRPVTWVTTQEFLDHFGLEKLEDLPGLDELKASGLLDTRPRVHVLQPGQGADGAAAEGEGEDSELAELEGLEDEGAEGGDDPAAENPRAR